MKINSVVQGSTYPDLREYCATELTKLDADLYPIGAVVPLMEMYHYRDLVDAVMHSVKCLPDSKARHLMGAGHPTLHFALQWDVTYSIQLLTSCMQKETGSSLQEVQLS